MNHFRRWGAVYILAVLTALSFGGMVMSMQPKIEQEGWSEFWSAVFENWQSEWLQLLLQATLLMGVLKHRLFNVEARDIEQLKTDVREIKTAVRVTPRRDDTADT